MRATFFIGLMRERMVRMHHRSPLPRRRTELPAEAAALRERLPRFDHALVEEEKRAGVPSAASTSFSRAARINGSMGDSTKPQVR